jgi:hypothetical protein
MTDLDAWLGKAYRIQMGSDLTPMADHVATFAAAGFDPALLDARQAALQGVEKRCVVSRQQLAALRQARAG